MENLRDIEPHTAQLNRILNSRTFRRSVQQANLLRELAKLTVREHWNSLTQKAIAIDIHKDAQGGAWVATTANRIRKSLEKYYRTEGRRDLVVVKLPEGAYIVQVDSKPGEAADPGASEYTTVPLEDFRRFIKAQCLDEDSPKEELDRRMRLWVSSASDFRRMQLTPENEFEDFFTRLPEIPELRLDDMKSIAKHLGIHPLMLDPLRSEAVEVDYLVAQLPGEPRIGEPDRAMGPRGNVSRFVLARPRPGESSYGHNAQYHFCEKRIAGSDACFICLQLSPGGSSDIHRHPGDELLIVMSGVVEVCFADSGLNATLTRGSYCHFFAEQAHSAHNISSNPAEIFIVRFQQLLSPNSRRNLASTLRRSVLSEQANYVDLNSTAQIGWLFDSLLNQIRVGMIESQAAAPAEVLQNRTGFARLALSSSHKRELDHDSFLRQLAEETGWHANSFETWLRDFVTGKFRFTAESIGVISRRLEIFELLMAGFLQPSTPGAVAVKRSLESETQRGESGFRDWIGLLDLTRSFESISAVDGVTYELPRRNLSCSDANIVWLALANGRLTQSNLHPGYELLLPFEGEFTVEYASDGGLKSFTVRAGQVGYYSSEVSHTVCNNSGTSAQALVVRYYGDAGTRSRKANEVKSKDIDTGS